jgi:PAS domain-containing protein
MPSNNAKRRRRRTGSTAHRYTPAEAVRATRVRHGLGATEIGGAMFAFVIAAALIVLVWVVTGRSIQDQRDQVRDLVQRNLLGQAAVMAKSVSQELLLIDQSLMILQQSWNMDSGLFDLNKWKTQVPALMSVTDDLFIADEKRIIRQDILPQAIGQGIASAYVSWPHGSLERLGEAAPKIGAPLGSEQTQPAADARRFIMYIVRPLDRPPGWLVGASFKTDTLAKLYSPTWFGANALAGIVDLQNGGLQTIIGPAARRPQTSLARSALYAAMSRTDNAVWTGESPIDGLTRMHAFYRVPSRDMSIVVAAVEAEAMAPADVFATGARGVAFAASLTLLAIAGIIAWTFYRYRLNRRRESVRLREATELERLRQDEGRLTDRAQLQSARLRALVENGSDGIAMIDAELRLLRWNRRFEQGIGVPLEENMALDAILRLQASLGLFDPPRADIPKDIEVEISRRVQALHAGEVSLPQVAGHGDRFLRGVPIPEGGLILLLTGVETLPRLQDAAPETAAPEVESAAAPVEW